jgi:hypothetical protein
MKKILVILLVSILTVPGLRGQGFNGSIEFKYYTQKDTSRNIYLVKNKLVRLDRYARKNDKVEGSFIFDLQQGEVKCLSPQRKVWFTQKSETPPNLQGQCVVTKGKSTKTIAGFKCSDYTVKNTEENTTILYWIAQDKFTFFTPLITLWNRKDKQSIYFAQIKNLPPGSMPLMSEEKMLDTGKSVSKLEVTKVSKTAPTDQQFMIPADYKPFEQ